MLAAAGVLSGHWFTGQRFFPMIDWATCHRLGRLPRQPVAAIVVWVPRGTTATIVVS
jgi:hypothetical protein